MSQPASASFPWSRIPEPAAGQKEYGQMSWPGQTDKDRPVIGLRGSAPGPAVLIVAGFQYPSYPAMHGLLRLTGSLDPARVRGSLLALPDASATDWDWLIEELLGPATVLIEMGGAGPDCQSAGYVTRFLSSAADSNLQAGLMAAGFGMDYLLNRKVSPSLRHPVNWMNRNDRLAIQVTLPENAANRDQETQQLYDGLVNALRVVGMLDGIPLTADSGKTVRPAGLIVSPTGGLWNPTVRVGQQIRVSDEIGWLDDPFGFERIRLTANLSGRVLWYSTVLSVQPREPLLMLVNMEN